MKQDKPKKCFFITNKIVEVDFRDTHILDRFIDDHGKLLPAKRTGLSSRFQRKVEQAVKRARYMALLPFVRR